MGALIGVFGFVTELWLLVAIGLLVVVGALFVKWPGVTEHDEVLRQEALERLRKDLP